MNFQRCALVFGATLLIAAQAMGGPIFYFGDDDCFGLGATCPDGSRFQTDLGGTSLTDYRTITDPAFTDHWSFDAPVSGAMNYVMPASPTTAHLIFRIAGMADVALTYDVSINGVSVGTIPLHPGVSSWQEVLTYSFAVPIGILDGTDTFSIPTDGSDGFIIDYAALEFDPVPEPSTWVLLAGGLGLIGLRRRRE